MLLAIALLALAGHSLQGQEPVPPDEAEQSESAGERIHKPKLKNIDEYTAELSEESGPGLLVRRRGREFMEYVPWESEETANLVFRYLKFWRGGEVFFMPGTYVVEQAFDVRGTPDLTISGTAGTVLEFAPGPETPPLTLAPLHRGDRFITVDNPEQMRVGWHYQLYAPGKDSTRVLEIEVVGIEGDRVEVFEPIAFMPKIEEIPAGCRVFEEVNIFRVRKCPRLTIQNLVLDGKHRGAVRGHTLYGGIYATGDYRAGERPTTLGLTVRGCTFRNFEGRGLSIYGIGKLLVESCGFYDIRAQALEVDHYSSGHILKNEFDGAEVGVMLNDAFESVVEANTIRNCTIGVRILRIFPEDWVNTGNVVAGNRIGPGCVKGIAFQDDIMDGVTDNHVLGNHFIGIGKKVQVFAGAGNVIEGNTHER